MNAPTQRFQVGDRVQSRSDRSKVGEVAKAPTPAQGEYWYKVRLSGGHLETLPESGLEPFRASQDPEGLFVEGRFGGPEDLVRKVTFHKLREPLENTLYSLGASRTEFYPHQFRPLLKFIDSEDQRLLIADEVGLGKTIEAGLILVELRARRQLDQAMVVCPAALTRKWQEELQRRFDEKFRIVSSRQLRALLQSFEERGELGEPRLIVSLQSLRQRGNRERLEALPVPLDLLIVDEAHHLRNPETLSHRTLDALAVRAEAVVFLTATPIHLGSENLFHLLRLLSPTEFLDLPTFDRWLNANAPVVQAERLARQRPVPTDTIRSFLEILQSGPFAPFFKENPFLGRCLHLVERLESGSAVEVALMGALKDVNLLSHIITRTRKRDAFERTPARRAKRIPMTPTAEEMDFYRSVTDFARSLHGSEVGSVFAAISAQRQVASSMQAAKEHFRQKALKALAEPEESDLDDDEWPDLPDPDDEAEPLSLPEQVLRAADRLGNTDTKYDALAAVLRDLAVTEPDDKILVFSFFKGTLRYLERRLRDDGFQCVRIDGDVRSDAENPDRDDRAALMKRFREDPNVRIMLSSEVGSEGLDFQFARVLVNYDLPWNPMRVEQRIGRLDRLGQKSNSIIIVNLSLPGTIDHEILERLFRRIGIFERSLGDLEAIVGDEIERLTRDLFSKHLTPAEEAERIERAGRVLEERQRQLDHLEKEGDRLVGRDEAFDERLKRARSGGEVLAAPDLRVFVSQFLDRRYPASQLVSGPAPGVDWLHVDDTLEADLRGQRDERPIWHRLLRRVGTGRGRVAVTFSSEQAFGNEDLEFLAPHHPLLRLAVDHYDRQPEELHPISALSLKARNDVAVGDYVYGVYEVTIRMGRSRLRLEPFVISCQEGRALPQSDASSLLGRMLREGKRVSISEWERPVGEALLHRMDEVVLARMADEKEDLVDRQQARVGARLASLESSFRRKIRRKEELLDEARASGKPDHYVRLLEGTIRNLTAEFEKRRAELDGEREVHLSWGLIAAGLLIVEA